MTEVIFTDNSVTFTGVCFATSALVAKRSTKLHSTATSIGAPPGATYVNNGAAGYLIMRGTDRNITMSTAQMVTNASKLALCSE